MLRLPVCPYCKTVFSYGEVLSSVTKRKKTCYHCKNEFKIGGLKSALLFILIFLTLTVVVNLALLGIAGTRNTGLLPIFLLDCVLVLAAYFTYPFFTEYKKQKNYKAKEIRTEKIISEHHKEKRSVKTRKRKADNE